MASCYTVKKKHYCLHRKPDHQQNRGRQLESRHNSWTELYNQNSYNSFPSKYRLLLVLLVSVLSFQRATRNPADRQAGRYIHTYIHTQTDYRMPPWLCPPKHNKLALNHWLLSSYLQCNGNIGVMLTSLWFVQLMAVLVWKLNASHKRNL